MCRKKVHKIFMSLLVNTLIFSSAIGFKAYAQNLEGEFDDLLERYKNENIVVENGLSLYVNDTFDVSQYPDWDILDSTIVEVDENGLLVAKNDGTTYISQKIGDTVYIAEINVCNELISPYSNAKANSSLDRSYYKVFLDPGHGGSDPGAISNGLYEDELNLSIANKVQNLLKSQGIDVKMSRTSDIFLSLNERANLANAYNGDVFVSIHNNAFSSSSAYGIETYYTASKPTSKNLATPIQNGMVSETGGFNRGVKTANYVVTKNTTMPASLVEGGFLTNTSEASKLKTDDYQNKLAKGIADGIVKYLKANVQLGTSADDNTGSDSTVETKTGTVTANSSLNVRSGAGTNYSVIGSLPSKATVEILETLNGWYKIKYNNTIGYVSSQYISITATSTPDNDSSNNNSSDSNNSDSNNNSATQVQTGKVTANSSLNVRSGAGTNHSIIGSLPSKATIEILETLNGWYKIKYNNITGYVSSQYVSLTTSSNPNNGTNNDNSNSNSNNSGSNSNSSTTQTKTGKVTANSSLNVRSATSTRSSIIGSLKSNATVEILETLNGWYKIKYNNTTGYVSSQYVSITSSGSSANSGTTQSKTGKVTANPSLNVRGTASTSSSIIGSLKSNATVEILETLNGW